MKVDQNGKIISIEGDYMTKFKIKRKNFIGLYLEETTQLVDFFGSERQLSVSREISKLHEETIRGTTQELVSHFESTPPKGEIVIVVEGKK